MHLLIYIALGAGLAAAAGLRPFLPALLAGALASGHLLGLGFDRGGFHFLAQGGWLVAVAAALVISYAVALRLGSERLQSGPGAVAMVLISVAVGALLFAATLAQHGDASWPGLIAGAACAALGAFAVRPILERTRRRLPDRSAREALTLYADGAALALTLLALIPVVGLVVVGLFAWLVVGSRRRAGEKYAGLRILRQ